MVTRNLNQKRPSGLKKTNEPKVMSELLNEYLQSGDPLAIALRDHLFRDLHPDTFLCVDLKVMRNEPGRMPVSEMLGGTLIRNGEENFTFIQDIIEKKGDYARNPHVYSGKHINVVRKKDGELWLTFNRPRYTEKFTFQDLCREAAKELLTIAGLVKKK